MAQDHQPDDELVILCQKGDQEAFRHLVDRYAPLAYRTAALIVDDGPVAEDIVQEAFVLAWRGMDKFRPLKPHGSLRAWLLRIVINRALSQRRRKVLPSVTTSAHEITATEGRSPLEDSLDQWELHHLIGQALGELRETYRTVMVLRHFAELSVPEIAKVLGWRQGTVKSRLHRALSELRRRLEPEVAMSLREEYREGAVSQ
jgi:RNA polymerase sigma-70 factor (ECF subfamily)